MEYWLIYRSLEFSFEINRAKHFFPILKQQFAIVQPFLKESPYTYRLQGYGRDNCLGIQVELSVSAQIGCTAL
jgi:hypothetical protein